VTLKQNINMHLEEQGRSATGCKRLGPSIALLLDSYTLVWLNPLRFLRSL
jgi:hypothetical protein